MRCNFRGMFLDFLSGGPVAGTFIRLAPSVDLTAVITQSLGRPRRRWVDNIRMDLQDVGCGYVDWIGLAQDRDRWRTLVSAVMNLWVL